MADVHTARPRQPPLLLFLFFLFFLAAPMAPPAAGQPVLTLDDALRESMAHNRSLGAARASAAEAGAQVGVAQSSAFPRITVTESWQRGNQPVFVFGSLLGARRFTAANLAVAALNQPPPIGAFRTALGVEQSVFDAGRRHQIRGVELRRDLAEAGVDEVAARVRLEVTQTYGRLVSLTASRQALASALEAARHDRDRVEQRRDAGLATNADVLSLAVHVSDLQQRDIQADGEAAVARAELNRLMGVPVDREYRIALPAGGAIRPPTRPSVAELLAIAEQARPELTRAALGEALSATARQQARAALVPQVAAQAGVEVIGTSVANRAASWVVGGEARWTFSTGGAQLAQLKATTEAASRARIDREDARASVEVEIVSALRRLDAAHARVDVGRALVEQARESQRITRDRFDAGLATVTDVLRVSAAVLDAEAQRSAADVDALNGAALLANAVGRDVLAQSGVER